MDFSKLIELLGTYRAYGKNPDEIRELIMPVLSLAGITGDSLLDVPKWDDKGETVTGTERVPLSSILDDYLGKQLSDEEKAERARLAEESKKLKDKEDSDRAAAQPGLQKYYENVGKEALAGEHKNEDSPVVQGSPITKGMANTDTGWSEDEIAKHVITTKNTFNDILCKRDPETKEYNPKDKAFADKVWKVLANARINGKPDTEAFMQIIPELSAKYKGAAKEITNRLREVYNKDAKFNEFCTGAKKEMKQRDALERKQNLIDKQNEHTVNNYLKTTGKDEETGAAIDTSGKENRSVKPRAGRYMNELEKLSRNGTDQGAKFRDLMNNAANILDNKVMSNDQLRKVIELQGRSDADHTVAAWDELFKKPNANIRITLSPQMLQSGNYGIVFTSKDLPEGISDFLSKPEDVKNFFKAMQQNNVPYKLDYNGAHQDTVTAAVAEAIKQGDPNIVNDRAIKEGIVSSMDPNGFITEKNLLEKGKKNHPDYEADNYYEHLAKILSSASPEQLDEYLNDEPITPSKTTKKYAGSYYTDKDGNKLDIDPSVDISTDPRYKDIKDNIKLRDLYDIVDEFNPVYDEDQYVRNNIGEGSADNMREAAKRIYSFINALYGTDGDVSVMDKALDASALNSLNGKATAAYKNWNDKLSDVRQRFDVLNAKKKAGEEVDPKELDYVASEYRKLLGIEGPSLTDTFKNIINNGMLGGNTSWSKISPRTSAEDFRDIALTDFILDSYNRKRNKANKEFFDPSVLREIIDTNLKEAKNALNSKSYDSIFGKGSNATAEDVQEIIDRLDDLRTIWNTPADIDELIKAIPEDVRKERLSQLAPYDPVTIKRLEEAKSRIEEELANSKAIGDNDARLYWKDQLRDINSELEWKKRTYPEIEALAKETGTSYGQALLSKLDEPMDDNGEYKSEWMRDIVQNIFPKWDIQSKIRDLLGGAKAGNQQAKRDYTVETLNALREKLPKEIINAMGEKAPGPFGKLFDQIDKAQDYGTGVPKGQLINMLVSRDKDRRDNASQLLGGKITPQMAAKWLNNKEALRSDYQQEHYNDTKTWAKGSPLITKEQMREGAGDTSHPMYEFSKLKQDAQYGVPGAAAALKNKIKGVEDKLGPSEKRAKLLKEVAEAAESMANFLDGIRSDIPGANDEE